MLWHNFITFLVKASCRWCRRRECETYFAVIKFYRQLHEVFWEISPPKTRGLNLIIIDEARNNFANVSRKESKTSAAINDVKFFTVGIDETYFSIEIRSFSCYFSARIKTRPVNENRLQFIMIHEMLDLITINRRKNFNNRIGR